MTYLRQPIISVLGHVDHGKTSLLDYIRKSKIISKEAGGITQHIGATEVSKKNIEKITKKILPANFIKIPGLLFIDTPGHKAFASLRKRGGSISDIGILVIDINEGFKPQTIEAVEILKSMKTPFIIAANKIDRINQFNSKPNTPLKKVLKEQTQECIYNIEEKIYEIVADISKFDLDAERYDRVEDFTKKIAIIPISSLTGIGIPELISTLIGLTQKFMEKKITIEDCNISKGVILEVKDYIGLGKTYDIILYDGVMKSGDIIIAMDSFNVQTGKIKSILKPLELKEISDNSTKFKTIKEISASSGIKISAPDLIDIPAGMQIMTFRPNEKIEIIEYHKSELEKEKLEITFTSKKEGILVKADTLGSLEAITNIFQEHNIAIRKARIGKITKTNIIDVSADLNLNPKNALIINFSQKIENEIIQMAKEYNVEIISSDIIYKLVEDANKWIEEKEKIIEREKLKNIIIPFKFKILTNHIFRTSNPAIIGIEVTGGTVKTNISLMTILGKKIGKIKTIKDNKDNLKKLDLNLQGAISIDNLIIGRHAQEESIIYSFMGEENFRNLKKNVNLLSRDEIQTLKEIAEIMRKEDTLWGL